MLGINKIAERSLTILLLFLLALPIYGLDGDIVYEGKEADSISTITLDATTLYTDTLYTDRIESILTDLLIDVNGNTVTLVDSDFYIYDITSDTPSIRFYDSTGLLGSVYGSLSTSENIGFLDSDGNWALRLKRDELSEFRINDSVELQIYPTYTQLFGNLILPEGATITTPTTAGWDIEFGDITDTANYGNVWFQGANDGSYGIRLYPRSAAATPPTMYGHIGYDYNNDVLYIGNDDNKKAYIFENDATNAQLTIEGVRPLYLYGSSYAIRKEAEASSGWAFGIGATQNGSDTTLISEWGMYGTGSTLNYGYFGSSYASTYLQTDSNGLAIGAATASDLSTVTPLVVEGTAGTSTYIDIDAATNYHAGYRLYEGTTAQILTRYNATNNQFEIYDYTAGKGILKIDDGGATTTVDSDFVATGRSGSMAYGELDHSSSGLITIPVANTWVQCTIFSSAGTSYNTTVSVANSDITILKAGDYELNYLGTGYATSSQNYEFAFFKNNGATQISRAFRYAVSSNLVAVLAKTYVTLSVNDTVELWVRNPSSATNLTIGEGTMLVNRLR